MIKSRRNNTGYLLTEMLVAISVGSVAMLIGSQLFVHILHFSGDASRTVEAVTRLQPVISQLRADVWAAHDLSVTNNHALIIRCADGSTIHWTIDADAKSIRRDAPSAEFSNIQWPLPVGSAFSQQSPESVTVQWDTHASFGNPVPMRFTSEILRTGGPS